MIVRSSLSVTTLFLTFALRDVGILCFENPAVDCLERFCSNRAIDLHHNLRVDAGCVGEWERIAFLQVTVLLDELFVRAAGISSLCKHDLLQLLANSAWTTASSRRLHRTLMDIRLLNFALVPSAREKLGRHFPEENFCAPIGDFQTLDVSVERHIVE